jgi:hypothetical protein
MTTKHPPHVDLQVDLRNIGADLLRCDGKIELLATIHSDLESYIGRLILADLETLSDKLADAITVYKTASRPALAIADYKAAKPPFHTKEPTATPFTEEIV